MLRRQPVADGRAGRVPEEVEPFRSRGVRDQPDVRHVAIDGVLGAIWRAPALPTASVVHQDQPATGESRGVAREAPHLQVAAAAGVEDERRPSPSIS
jgi:hypothetical protein